MIFLQMDRIFLLNGRNFWPFWPENVEKSWEQCLLPKNFYFPCIRANFRQKNLVLQFLYAFSPLNEEGGQGTESTHPLLQVNETLKVLLGLHMLTKEEKLAKQLIRFYQCSYENSKNSLVFIILTK